MSRPLRLCLAFPALMVLTNCVFDLPELVAVSSTDRDGGLHAPDPGTPVVTPPPSGDTKPLPMDLPDASVATSATCPVLKGVLPVSTRAGFDSVKVFSVMRDAPLS